MGVTFVLWLRALNISKSTALIGNLVFLSPFLSLIFINLILHEQIMPSTIVGLVLIILGIKLHRTSIVLKPKSPFVVQ